MDNVLDRQALIKLCSDPYHEVLSKVAYGNTVLRISGHLAVKFGVHVKEAEAQNQRKAYQLLNPHIVRVPKVHDFFEHASKGYLVMEFIEGQTIDPLEDEALVKRLSDVLKSFERVSNYKSGPLQGNMATGCLWPEGESVQLNGIEDVECFYKSRLRKTEPTPALTDFSLVLCHLDFVPRNILWLHDGTICLLDWESAGFYPRLFEVCRQRIFMGQDGKFNKLLLDCMPPLTMEEERQAEWMMLAFRNMQRYHLYVHFFYVQIPKLTFQVSNMYLYLPKTLELRTQI